MLETTIKNKITELQSELDVLLSRAAGVETAIKALEGVLNNEPAKELPPIEWPPIQWPPIKVENLERLPSKRKYSFRRAEGAPNKIFNFLQKQSGKGFHYTEIAFALNLTPSKITSALSDMKLKGLVINKNAHWFLA